MQTRGYAAPKAGSPLAPFSFARREPGERDLVIEILYCGVCHSDIHQVRDEWGGSSFPMVPGHEIVGRVNHVGTKVKRFKPGDTAGVGCMVGSCGVCANCKKGLEQFCSKGPVWTYNSPEPSGKGVTYGGYSSQIVVEENFALKISPSLPLDRVAPLLCAGITTFSPMRHWKVGKGSRVGVLGMGGLGHMAVKNAVGLGADVTVFSRSVAKEKGAKTLGAQHFVATSGSAAMASVKGHFDFLIDTVSAPHSLLPYIDALDTDGVMVLVGVPPKPSELEHFSLIGGRKSLAGSLIGGVRETQEMLDWCAEKKVLAEIELIPMAKINEAYDRMVKGDVHYRFVVDLKTL